MAPDKLTIIDWKDNQCIVNWQLHHWPEERTTDQSRFISATREFRCPDMNKYELFFSYGYSDLLLVVNIIPSEFSTDSLPVGVSAIFNGEMKDLIVQETPSYQAYTKWENKIVLRWLPLKNLYMENYPHQYPSVQFIFEFQSQVAPPASRHISSGERCVLDHLSKLFETQSAADIIFIVKGQSISAHSVILASGSPVFAAMFQDGFAETRTKRVTIEDMEPEVFHDLLRYLYTGVIKFNDRAESIWTASDKYQIDSLKSHCEDHLCSTLTVDNVVQRLILAHFYSSTKLLNEAIYFIEQHKEDVWFRRDLKDLGKKHPDLFFLVTQKLVIG